jgi:hypothetical protein
MRRPGQRDGVYRKRPPRGCLPALCWCKTETVAVAKHQIKAGLTRSCGLPRCDVLDRAARADR